MLITIDPQAKTALFEQVTAAIRTAVVTGDLEPGERLPAARELATSLEVNMHTVLRAYRTLRTEGLIQVRPGRGTVVSAQHSRDYQPLRRALAELVREGDRVGLSRDGLADLVRHAPGATA
ncbi:MAG TPA: GntR family transcriptional regulator [Ruania sp.]|nr:GntR family transcriptional regulator [Ruania sp.]